MQPPVVQYAQQGYPQQPNFQPANNLYIVDPSMHKTFCCGQTPKTSAMIVLVLSVIGLLSTALTSFSSSNISIHGLEISQSHSNFGIAPLLLLVLHGVALFYHKSWIFTVCKVIAYIGSGAYILLAAIAGLCAVLPYGSAWRIALIVVAAFFGFFGWLHFYFAKIFGTYAKVLKSQESQGTIVQHFQQQHQPQPMQQTVSYV